MATPRSLNETVTDSEGRAENRLTFGESVGTIKVRAVANGTDPLTFTLSSIAGPVTSLAVDPDSAVLQEGEELTLSLEGTDDFGNPGDVEAPPGHPATTA
jgi:hypothetical protein